MKSTALSYHRTFPWTPVSGWVGSQMVAWRLQQDHPGRRIKIVQVQHRFADQRPMWCLLTVTMQGVQLHFATPQELDHVLDVLGQNPMPSGRSLVPSQGLGRPNSHWLSRLPKRAKTTKFRAAFARFVARNADVRRFRAFYERQPVDYHVTPDGVFESYFAAHLARQDHLAKRRDLPVMG